MYAKILLEDMYSDSKEETPCGIQLHHPILSQPATFLEWNNWRLLHQRKRRSSSCTSILCGGLGTRIILNLCRHVIQSGLNLISQVVYQALLPSLKHLRRRLQHGRDSRAIFLLPFNSATDQLLRSAQVDASQSTSARLLVADTVHTPANGIRAAERSRSSFGKTSSRVLGERGEGIEVSVLCAAEVESVCSGCIV